MAGRAGKKPRDGREQESRDPVSGMTETEMAQDVDRILARLERMSDEARLKDAVLMDRVRGHG